MKKYLSIFGAASMIDSIFKWYPSFLEENIKDATIVIPEKSLLIDKSNLAQSCHNIDIPRKPSVFLDLLSLLKLLIFIYKGRFDVVHSFMPKAGFITALSILILRMFGKKIIYVHTFTGLVWSGRMGWRAWLLSRFDLLITLVADYVLVESKGVYNEIITLNSKSNLMIIGCGNMAGVDLDYFKPSISKNHIVKKNIMRLVYIGRVSIEKGIFDILCLFDDPLPFDISLDIVGGLELSDIDLERFNQIVKKNKNIRYLGFVSDVRPYLEEADYFIFASWREGFANAILQSLAMGVPVISSRVNGIDDILEKLDNSESIGFFFNIKDVGELKLKVFDAYRKLNQDEYLKMRSESIKVIQLYYSSEIAYQGLKDFYREIGVVDFKGGGRK